MEKVRVIIDGQEIYVPKNTTVLEAAKKLNILIPTFCYNEKLPIFGGCRMCLVWDKKWNRSIIACGTYVYDGMEIETLNDEVFNDRKFILEMLFTRHPLDCPICDKAGECDLQNWGTYYGPQHPVLPISPFEKIRPEDDWQSDFLEYVSNRCVLCMRCISVCQNINRSDSLYQKERGFEIVISPDEKPMDTKSSCEMCGLCVDICPVGAILFKPFKYKARPWLLKERVSYCGFCSMNCPIAIDYDDKKKKIYRMRSTGDLQVCSGAYLGYDVYESKQKAKGALIQGKNVSFTDAINEVSKIISNNPLETAYISSPYATSESFTALNSLREKTGIEISSIITIDYLPTIYGYVEEAGKDYEMPTFKDIEKATKVVIVGNDISATTPVLSYFFGESYKEGNKVSDKKEVVYVGNRLKTTAKFFPKVVSNLGDVSIDEKTVVVYSPTSYQGEDAYQFGKKLAQIEKQTKAKVLILPPQTNAIGQLNQLNIDTFLPKLIEKIENGIIKNLIIEGEDIFQYVQEKSLREAFKKLDSLIVLSEFLPKVEADVFISLPLWVDEEGHFEGFFGSRKAKPLFKTGFTRQEIIRKITDHCEYTPRAVLPEREPLRFYNSPILNKPDINIWDFGYYSQYSENLQNWKNKNVPS